MCLLQDPCVAHVISWLEVIKGFCKVYQGPAAWLSAVRRITACKQMLMQQDAQIGCYALSLCRTLSPFLSEQNSDKLNADSSSLLALMLSALTRL